MPPLDPGLRTSLEKAVLAAREASERAANAALDTLAVRREPFTSLSADQRKLRNALRARARQLGGGKMDSGFPLLVEEVAYEQWHRMLFARFLAENGLLIHPSGGSVTLEDCSELAAEEGEPDAWEMAARYASGMLPGIFRLDDPSTQVRFAPEGRLALEGILAGLPQAVFTADDGLGWVYQFWQSKRKKAVSSSGQKIERLDLAAYSQLFTEHYMVQFLLQNSLGAWWAARHPESPLVKEFSYLRYREDGTPAAGTFGGWPERAADVTVMDPCCGSGHFLLEAFHMLRRMRIEEDGIGEVDAADAVLRDNLFGLEIDPRCVQIAAFTLALAAWKAGGYRPLPALNLACSGIPVSGQLEEWTKLAGDDADLRHTFEQLHQIFRNAPDLGSLINPADVPVRDRMFAADFSKVGPILERALTKQRVADDPVAAVFGEAAKATARATELLARGYTLVATNVPYLARGKQGEALKEFIERRHPEAKADLATAFLERCRAFSGNAGTYALVTPQNWLFLGSYRKLRETFLREQSWQLVARLGPGAFETISGEVVNVALVLFANHRPAAGQALRGLDASAPRTAREKADMLRAAPLETAQQAAQLTNPDARIALLVSSGGLLLSEYASAYIGLHVGDWGAYRRGFWEVPELGAAWSKIQNAISQSSLYAGREHILYWPAAGRMHKSNPNARVQGTPAWGNRGIAISLMDKLPATIYMGELFRNGVAALIPRNPDHFEAIWAYCSSSEFHDDVRHIDQKLYVTCGTLVKVPFDLERWQKAAEETGSLPDPYSSDPTQWLFKGDPADSTDPLQVAVARLLGYRWPQQELDHLGPLADGDRIVPLPAVAGKVSAAERLRALLAVAFGDAWSPALQERLLAQAGFGRKGLDLWLRDGFFEQHCKLFHQRPFIWQIWDGRKDGFSALLNYHALDAAHLGKLIYTYLGDWIRTQRAGSEAGVAGADGRLVAAIDLQKKLEAIREGEQPLDIYVRWKPLERQPIGWEPDLDDGVRLNIRPFVKAGVLRSRVNVNWNKDRGLNPDGSERLNDAHLKLADKLAARKAAGR